MHCLSMSFSPCRASSCAIGKVLLRLLELVWCCHCSLVLVSVACIYMPQGGGKLNGAFPIPMPRLYEYLNLLLHWSHTWYSWWNLGWPLASCIMQWTSPEVQWGTPCEWLNSCVTSFHKSFLFLSLYVDTTLTFLPKNERPSTPHSSWPLYGTHMSLLVMYTTFSCTMIGKSKNLCSNRS